MGCLIYHRHTDIEIQALWAELIVTVERDAPRYTSLSRRRRDTKIAQIARCAQIAQNMFN